MTHITCRLTAKNRDQLRNSTLGNRVWATFYLFYPFTVSRYCPTPVSPIYFPTFLSVSPLNLASYSAERKITKIVAKVGGDQIHLVPIIPQSWRGRCPGRCRRGKARQPPRWSMCMTNERKSQYDKVCRTSKSSLSQQSFAGLLTACSRFSYSVAEHFTFRPSVPPPVIKNPTHFTASAPGRREP